MNNYTTIAPLLLISLAVGLIPLFAVVATSFTKISVVLLIVRNALGIQQTPPNLVLYTVAIVLSFHIMSPMIDESVARLNKTNFPLNTSQEVTRTATNVAEPFRTFLMNFSNPKSREFFQNSRAGQAQAGSPAKLDRGVSDFAVLVPAFLLDELTRAFELGLLIYLPFIAIDFVVSAVLIAMGMQMMSSSIISTPIKVLLFVKVEGWVKLFESLTLSYTLT